MKTPHDHDVAARTQAQDARTRAKRTAAKFACEPLEGRNLMTGFAGAGAMMGHGPAEMGDMGGPGGDDFQRHDRMDRFGGPDAGSAQADATSSGSGTTDASATGPAATGAAGWTPSFAQDGRARADRGFGGSGDRMDDSFGMMGDRGGDRDIPFAGPGGQGNSGDSDDSGQDSTGSTQLKTDMDKLRTDEQAIHDKSQVTPALQAAVRKDQQAIDAAKTGTASDTATQQLKTDEQTIFGTPSGSSTSTSSSSSTTATMPTTPPTLTDAQKATLQADHDAILTSQGVSQDLIDQLAKDQLAVKTASNFTDADQATLDADHKAIQADLDSLHSGDATAPTTGSNSTPTSTAATTSTTTAAPTATPATADATPPAAPAPTDAAPAGNATVPTMTAPATGATDPTATAPLAPTSQPGSTTINPARPEMNRHRGGMGGSDAQFMHHVSTADHSLSRSSDVTGQTGGRGMGGGSARRDFRR